jgi:hypothetical protein
MACGRRPRKVASCTASACKECLDRMEYANVVGNDWQGTSKECNIGTDWMIGGMDSPLLAFSPNETFPKGYLQGGQWSGSNGTKVYPIELTYDTLKRAAMVTQQKLLSGEWSPTVAKSHLKENGINEGYRNLIVRQGGNRCTFDLMKEEAKCGGAGVVELAVWQKFNRKMNCSPPNIPCPKHPVCGIEISLYAYLWIHQCTFCFWVSPNRSSAR